MQWLVRRYVVELAGKWGTALYKSRHQLVVTLTLDPFDPAFHPIGAYLTGNQTTNESNWSPHPSHFSLGSQNIEQCLCILLTPTHILVTHSHYAITYCVSAETWSIYEYGLESTNTNMPSTCSSTMVTTIHVSGQVVGHANPSWMWQGMRRKLERNPALNNASKSISRIIERLILQIICKWNWCFFLNFSSITIERI